MSNNEKQEKSSSCLKSAITNYVVTKLAAVYVIVESSKPIPWYQKQATTGVVYRLRGLGNGDM